MIYILHNILPIALATLAGLLVTAAFYAPRAPGWRRALPVAALAELWLCAILAGGLILAPKLAGPWVMALGTAAIIWLGFIVPATVATNRLRSLSWRATLTDLAHWLAVMLAQAAVLRAIGVAAVR